MKPQSFARFCAAHGLILTPAQAVLAAVCFDGVEPRDLADDERAIATELFGDVDTVTPIAREIVLLLKGARVGGSLMTALRGYLLTLTCPVELAPGESAYGLFVGPDTRLARQAFRYAVGAARADAAEGRIKIVRESDTSFTYERHDGTLITLECLPATSGGSAVRGRTIIFAQMTEGAFFRDADSVVNDQEVYRAMAARIVRGGQLIIESTPWAQRGLVYELYRDNFADPKTALVARCPTVLMRPAMRDLVERERQRDPDNAAREFECAFLEGGVSDFLDAVGIGLAIDRDRPSLVYASAGAFVGAGGDIALQRNASALAIVARTDNRYELLEIAEKKPEPGQPLKLGKEVLQESFAPVLQRHGLRSFMADGHVREPAREFCAETKILIGTIAHTLTIDEAPEGNAGKVESYQLLQTLIREGRFTMAAHSRLESQLRSIVSRPMAGGGVRISSPVRPDGSHGDLVSALVNAVWAATLNYGAYTPPRITDPSGRWADDFGWSRGRGY